MRHRPAATTLTYQARNRTHCPSTDAKVKLDSVLEVLLEMRSESPMEIFDLKSLGLDFRLHLDLCQDLQRPRSRELRIICLIEYMIDLNNRLRNTFKEYI